MKGTTVEDFWSTMVELEVAKKEPPQ